MQVSEATSTSFCTAMILALYHVANELPSGTGHCSFRWSCDEWSSGMCGMCLMVCRKSCRCGQSRLLLWCPSPPSIWWTSGVVALGYCYIGRHNSTNTGAVSMGTQSCILEQSPASVLHAQGQQDRLLRGCTCMWVSGEDMGMGYESGIKVRSFHHALSDHLHDSVCA
jgi:hypothetical protein